MKQKFQADQKVQFAHTSLTKAVYWIVIAPEPDSLGCIVILNPRSNEYCVAYQRTLKAL